MFDDEMMKALEADGEKLKALTGQDHGPHFIPEQPCEVCVGSGEVLVPTTGYECCGNVWPDGQCCGSAIEVDLGPHPEPCRDCNGTGKKGGA